MSNSVEESRKTFGNMSSIPNQPLTQTKTSTTKSKKHPKIAQIMVEHSEAEEENQIYVSQLQELARVFSSSGDRHIRQYIINLARGVIERSNDYTKAEAYISEMLS